MNLDATTLRSKVARRIVTLFILCALVPVGALALISFHYVTAHLHEESRRRLHQAGKAVGLAIYERLLFLEARMRMLGSGIDPGTDVAAIPTGFRTQEFAERFEGLALVHEGGRVVHLYGDVPDLPSFSEAERDHMRSGRGVVSSLHRPDRPARIFMSCAVDPDLPARGILVGAIAPAYVWGLANLPPGTELSVIDASNDLLISSIPGAAPLPRQMNGRTTRRNLDWLEWEHEGREYLASYWSIPLAYGFKAPPWTVVLSESKADALSPTTAFKKAFLPVLLLSLWIVLFLSVFQIRRSMVPLETLREGTRRIAEGNFDSRVVVTSRDEFEELGASFNTMANRLGRQFRTLAIISEIDRSVLSALDTSRIVDTVLSRLPELFPCDAVCVTLLDRDTGGSGRTYVKNDPADGKTLITSVSLTPEERSRLSGNPRYLLVSNGDVPGYARSINRREGRPLLILPIFVQQQLSGLITLGCALSSEPGQEDVAPARQLADQVAVALSNARLIEELAELNWGTLIALSRTIDAKSPWTLGHSERAANLALRIGQVMGFSQKKLDDLQRGALLHDIGKIAMPPAILDKPGRLTDDEMAIVRRHPRDGARILEPIAAFREAIPVVLQHHEWFDGSGYPDGASGEAIGLIARVYTVADVFDALHSDRPYRPGLDRREIIEYIVQRSGTQFDPQVVPAFLEVMAREETDPELRTARAALENSPRWSELDAAIRKGVRSG